MACHVSVLSQARNQSRIPPLVLCRPSENARLWLCVDRRVASIPRTDTPFPFNFPVLSIAAVSPSFQWETVFYLPLLAAGCLLMYHVGVFPNLSGACFCVRVIVCVCVCVCVCVEALPLYALFLTVPFYLRLECGVPVAALVVITPMTLVVVGNAAPTLLAWYRTVGLSGKFFFRGGWQFVDVAFRCV